MGLENKGLKEKMKILYTIVDMVSEVQEFGLFLTTEPVESVGTQVESTSSKDDWNFSGVDTPF